MMKRPVIKLHDTPEDAYGYIVDLSTVQLSETDTSWIQAAPHGTWDHPIYGKLDFNPERTKRFADNVKSNVRGQDLDIDYDHKQLTTEAAGWVRDAEARTDGLWLLVEWTKSAAAKIKEGAYKYFSPEFVDEWQHPATGKKYRDVLFGGGITNRPYLKGILPINLSELAGSDHDPSQEEDMDRKFLELLAKNLGVEFTDETSDEDLQNLVTEASEALEPAEDPNPNDDPENDDPEDDPEDGLTDEDAQLVGAASLSELTPAMRVLLSERKEDRKRMDRLEAANRLSETNVRLSELGNDKRKLTPKVRDKVRKMAVKLSETSSTELFDLLNDILDGGIVELVERGKNKSGSTGTSASEQFNTEVTKLTEGEKGMSYADAVEKVASDHPELFDAYREEATAGVDG